MIESLTSISQPTPEMIERFNKWVFWCFDCQNFHFPKWVHEAIEKDHIHLIESNDQ